MDLPLTCVEAPVRRGFPTTRCARCGGSGGQVGSKRDFLPQSVRKNAC